MSSEKKEDLVFKALADRRRRDLLDLLKDGPRTTGDLCRKLRPLDRCTVMQHLGVLEKAGLVIAQKKGRYRWNYLDVAPLRAIYDRWINKYASPSVELLTVLKNDLEKK
ncbi:MAG: helix-turn-helix transcriptional regulator [Chloracidobacterium sp.]|nr:helix-turn-helix transcriptional regulator [Chloracidobacterium sp.]